MIKADTHDRTTDRRDISRIDLGFVPVTCFHSNVCDFTDSLTSGEFTLISSAVTKRRHEFSTGRWLARRAMHEIGFVDCELLSGASRQPAWPKGIVGSITHTDGHAVSAVALSSTCRGLGIDMERIGRVNDEILPKLLTENEISNLGSLDPTLIFSAKEACYKVLYPMIGEYVGFRAVEVLVDENEFTFTARYVGKSTRNAIIDFAKGRFQRFGQYWITCMVLI